jgi:hypothetical protein
MNLSGLLEKLKGLFTPSFLISSVTPLFCFILVNGAILGQYNHAVRTWVSDYYLSSSASKAVTGAILSIVLLVIAYIFSTLNLTLVESLQGKHLPKWLEYRLRAGETSRFDEATSKLKEIRKLRREFFVEAQSWIRTLKARPSKEAEPGSCDYHENHPAHVALERLLRTRATGAIIDIDALRNCFRGLSSALATNSPSLPNNPDSIRLDRDRDVLHDLIIYAVRKVEDEYIRLFNEKEFNFSRYTVTPTQMGNVAASVRSYALSRYGMNLDFFWPRLQKILQSKSEFYKTLQDAKTQLDFTVSLFWLTVLSTAVWLVLLPFLSRTWLPLFSVWLFGPLIAITWYRMAVQNYRSFAELLRSCIDLFRFELLTDLKIPLPQDSHVEQQTWDRLNHWISYGEEGVIVGYKTE